MNKLPGPYDNGPEYEGLISRIFKRFRTKAKINAQAVARRKAIEKAIRDCKMGMMTPNQARAQLGMEPIKDCYDFITVHTPSSPK